MSKLEEIITEVNTSGYEDGELGAGHPAPEYKQIWLDCVRVAVAEEILDKMETNNDPWKNHVGVVRDYIASSQAKVKD